MTFLEAIKTCFKKYCVFSGRARRSEYWFFVLFTELLGLGINIISQILSGVLTVLQDSSEELVLTTSVLMLIISGIMMFISLLIFLPSLAVKVRRLHDAGRSGKWILIPMICNFIGVMVFVTAFITALAMVNFDVDALVDSEETLIVLVIGAVCMLIPLFISFVFSIIIFVWTIKDSQPGINKWGPNPKGIGNSSAVYAGASTASSAESEGSPVTSDKVEELKKYKQLLDEDIITEEEFEQKKKELLDL